jgi:hypothetical protein
MQNTYSIHETHRNGPKGQHVFLDFGILIQRFHNVALKSNKNSSGCVMFRACIGDLMNRAFSWDSTALLAAFPDLMNMEQQAVA